MHVIPVIDIQDGVVVRATGGDRAAYRAIETPLSFTPDSCSVIRGLLGVHPFETVYVADLDAIQGGSMQTDTLHNLRVEFPILNIWVDCGIRDDASLEAFKATAAGRAVIGSETLADPTLLTRGDPILSLDFKDGRFIGDGALLADPTLWPATVIAMSLTHVGSALGPDFSRIETLLLRKPGAHIYAAGGIRDIGDLHRLRQAGAAGALVSTALHAGVIDGDALAAFAEETQIDP